MKISVLFLLSTLTIFFSIILTFRFSILIMALSVFLLRDSAFDRFLCFAVLRGSSLVISVYGRLGSLGCIGFFILWEVTSVMSGSFYFGASGIRLRVGFYSGDSSARIIGCACVLLTAVFRLVRTSLLSIVFSSFLYN